MKWLKTHQRVWRLAILLLLLIAIAGPWAFDLVNVPAEYSCAAPYVRLKRGLLRAATFGNRNSADACS